MGRRSRRGAGAKPIRLKLGKVYKHRGQRWLALDVRGAERLVSLRGGAAKLLAPTQESKEIKLDEPSVLQLCQGWGVSVEHLDAFLGEEVYGWRDETRAALARGAKPGWRGLGLARGAARGVAHTNEPADTERG